MTNDTLTRINNLIEVINVLIAQDEFKGYKASPLLKEIVDDLQKYDREDEESLEFRFSTFNFVADTYKRMCRFSLSAKYHESALDVSLILFNKYQIILKDLDALFLNILRERNHYIDDNCEDVLAKITPLLEPEVIKKIYGEVMNRRRNLKADPIEMSEEYLAVIDEVEEKIDENRTMFGMGACFEIWNLKAHFLAEKGINWSSPAALNPRVMFD